MCGGLEPRLFDCDKGELEETNCNHNQDAGVICLPGELVILQFHSNCGVSEASQLFSQFKVFINF